MPPAILFDLDGTLVESRIDLAKSANLMRADHGLPPLPVPQIVGYVGNGVRKLVQRTLADAPGLDIDAAVQTMGKRYLEHLLDETSTYPGTVESLERLATAGFALGVVTNKPQIPSERICEALGIARFARVIVGGGACPELKPSPVPARQALALLGASPEGSWFVGDHYTDLRAGRAAGLRTCFCRFGFGDAQGEVADLEVDSLPAFADHVLRGQSTLD